MGSAPLMPARIAGRRSSLSDAVARERIVSGSRPSRTKVLAARIRRGRDQGGASLGRPELTMRSTSSQGRPGLRRRTSGTHCSALAFSFWKWLSTRAARAFRIAAGSWALRPGLPPTRPSALAERSPALVKHAPRKSPACRKGQSYLGKVPSVLRRSARTSCRPSQPGRVQYPGSKTL